jgi:hypothetical protein
MFTTAYKPLPTVLKTMFEGSVNVGVWLVMSSISMLNTHRDKARRLLPGRGVTVRWP